MKTTLKQLRTLIREETARALGKTKNVRLMREAAGDKCLNCGSPKEEGDRFCGECGCNVSEECIGTKCDAHVDVSDQYCGECGSPQLRKDPEAKEHLQKWWKKKDELKLRAKLWKDAGGKSNEEDTAESKKIFSDYEQALENRVMARISKDPKFDEIDSKFQEARKNFKSYIKNNVKTGLVYYTSLVKAGIASDEEKKMAEQLKQHAEKYS